jgi:hypothetical protein
MTRYIQTNAKDRSGYRVVPVTGIRSAGEASRSPRTAVSHDTRKHRPCARVDRGADEPESHPTRLRRWPEYSIGKTETDPHLFDGLCDRPCGLTLQDKNNSFDLRGKAKIRWTTIVSGFHRARPLIKLPDGTLLIGDQAAGSVADWQQSEVSFSEVRWLKLDPDRGVTLGNWVSNPDLSKVEEVGFFDVIPGSGVRVDGVPVEKLPAPPVGGWIAMSAFELWGKPAGR